MRDLDSLDVHHAVFLVQPLTILLSYLLLIKTREPAASLLLAIVGAMQNTRNPERYFWPKLYDKLHFL